MFGVTKFVRQSLLAVLVLSNAVAWSAVRTVLGPYSNTGKVTGLASLDRASLVANPEKVFLQSRAVSSQRSAARYSNLKFWSTG